VIPSRHAPPRSRVLPRVALPVRSHASLGYSSASTSRNSKITVYMEGSTSVTRKPSSYVTELSGAFHTGRALPSFFLFFCSAYFLGIARKYARRHMSQRRNTLHAGATSGRLYDSAIRHRTPARHTTGEARRHAVGIMPAVHTRGVNATQPALPQAGKRRYLARRKQRYASSDNEEMSPRPVRSGVAGERCVPSRTARQPAVAGHSMPGSEPGSSVAGRRRVRCRYTPRYAMPPSTREALA